MKPGAGSGSTGWTWLCPVPHHPLLLLPLQGKCIWNLVFSIWEGVWNGVLGLSVFVYLIIFYHPLFFLSLKGESTSHTKNMLHFLMVGHPLRLPLQGQTTAFVNCELSKIYLGTLIFNTLLYLLLFEIFEIFKYNFC